MTNRELTSPNPIEIPDAAGRAGAAAYVALPDLVDSLDDVVRAILEAAAPLIVAAELERIAEDGTGWAIATHLRRRATELKAGVDEPAKPRDLIDPIAAALSLLDRFETPGDRGRVQALIGDLRQVLAGA